MKKITGFAGSNSSVSINKQLVEFVIGQMQDINAKILDLNDYEMPIFSIDLEKNGYPEQVYAFRKEMEDADFLVCSLAEHNGTYSAALKNILDWCSRIDRFIFANKPMFLMSSSPGGYAGGNVMGAAKIFFPKVGAEIIETFSLGKFHENFQNGSIVNPDILAELSEKIENFTKVVLLK